MSFFFSGNEINNRYEFRQDHPTISKLVKPSDDSYINDTPRTGDSAYESTRRSSGDRYTVQTIPGVNIRQENDRPNNNFEYTRRVPTADVFVDPIRRPIHGNARTCCMEINIAVTLGPDRTPHASVISSNIASKPPSVRSTATFEDVRYVDLCFQAPENTAQLSTDGIMHRSPSQKSTGFRNGHINE
jgi:hypothetical protein